MWLTRCGSAAQIRVGFFLTPLSSSSIGTRDRIPRSNCRYPSASRSGMARKLKTYQTSLGFFDQAIAAPSMKAALEAWGADSNLFHQGAAKESHDPDVIAATMAKPGVVLRRPVGTDRPF